MKKYSWKVVSSVLGLRLIPMKVMPEIYDGKANIKFRFLWIFIFYFLWLFTQSVILTLWFIPFDLLSVELALGLLPAACSIASVIALIFSGLDFRMVFRSECLLNQTDVKFMSSLQNDPVNPIQTDLDASIKKQ